MSSEEKKPLNNARSETVHEKKSYREPFKTKRCLLLARKFFEYGSCFHLQDFEAFAIAGIWDAWEVEGERIESCSMLTTVANEKVAAVHPRKRMPVILKDDRAIQQWLSPHNASRERVECLFAPFPPDRLEVYLEE